MERGPPSVGFYARSFLIPKKNGKMCPVFNMKPLNHSIVARTFKMATLKMVCNSLRAGDFVVSLDLPEEYGPSH